MSETTDAPQEAAAVAPARKPAAERKPRFALFIATACGLGYIPKAPGTFGSLAGVLVTMVPLCIFLITGYVYLIATHGDASLVVWALYGGHDPFLIAQLALSLLVGAFGVWSGGRAAGFWRQKDPQRVVIDEVSGQHLAILLGCTLPVWLRATDWSFEKAGTFGMLTQHAALNWKYLLLGFILFRAFDIWKPFPARQAESLPGGWGIMADDWIAGIYAGIGLWIARAAGL